MSNLPLPQRMFCKGGEPDQRKKLNFYFVLKYLGTVKKALEKHKKEWSQLWNSQFWYLLEHGGDVAFSVQFAHFMLSRQLVTEKKHEIWMQFGGAPIRFSIQEFSAATGLNCSRLPEIPQKLTDVENFDEHESIYWDDLIGNDLGEIDDEWNLDRKISEVHVELVRDVEKFLNYPWGREAFSLAMKSIKTRGAEGLCQKTLAIQGFLHGMQLAMLKYIPHIKTRATYTPGAKKKKKGSTYATTSGEEVEVDDNTSLKPLTIKMSKIHDMDSKGKDDFKFDDEVVDTKVNNLLERIVNGPAFTIRCWSGGKHFNDVPPSVRQAKRKSATASGTGTTDETHVVAEEIAGSYHKQAMEALQQVELRFLKQIEDLKAELAKSKSTATEKAHVMDVDKDAHPNTEKGENDKERDLSSNDKEGEEDQASPTDKNIEKGENDKKRDLSSNDKEGEEYQASPTDKRKKREELKAMINCVHMLQYTFHYALHNNCGHGKAKAEANAHDSKDYCKTRLRADALTLLKVLETGKLSGSPCGGIEFM
ncbi:hypothetical protein Bca4012_052062 [Brassica carinata]